MKTRLIALFSILLFVLASANAIAAEITPCDAILAENGETPRLVDTEDFEAFMSTYNENEGDPGFNPKADFNSDGTVNFADYTVFMSMYGKTCNAAPVLKTVGNQAVVDGETLRFTITEGKTLSLTLYAEDPDGDTITYKAMFQPGTSSFNQDTGEFSWTPSSEEVGIRSMMLIATDGELSDGTIVTIEVLANQAPVFNTIPNQEGREFIEVRIPVHSYVSDPEGDAIVYRLIEFKKVGGNVMIRNALRSDGVFVWMPSLSQSGEYTITVEVTDGIAGHEQRQTFGLNVLNFNMPPEFNSIGGKLVYEGQTYNFDANEAQLIELLVDAKDIDGNEITYSATNLPEGATFENQKFSWIPSYTQSGDYSVTFKISDGEKETEQSVNIKVNNVNRNPVIDSINLLQGTDISADGEIRFKVVEGQPLEFDVVAHDPDTGETFRLITLKRLPWNALFERAVHLYPEGGKFLWTPDSNQGNHGSLDYTFDFAAYQDKDNMDIVKVTVTVVDTNHAPVFVDNANYPRPARDTQLVYNDNWLRLEWHATDPDEGDRLTYSLYLYEEGKEPKLIFNNWPESQQYIFQYVSSCTRYNWYLVAKDSSGFETKSPVWDFRLECPPPIPPNTAPVANAGTATTNEDTAATITLTGSDADGNALTYSIVSNPTKGILSNINSATGQVTYTPNSNYYGADSFTFKVNDGTVDSNVATTVSITVTSVNDLPAATADSTSTPEDTSVLIDVLANDNDVEDALAIYLVGSASHGTAVIESGKIRYTPSANYYGADSFTYTASDSDGATATATVSITVTSVNDLPAANADSASTSEDTAVLIDVLANDFDIEYGISINSVSAPSHGAAVIESGKIRYTPSANYYGADSFTYQLIDNEAATSTATVTVTVTSANDLPAATADSTTTPEDTAILIDVLANDNDVEGALAISSVSSASHGTAVVESGKIRYTPSANYYGADSFTYTASDSDGATATATVSITVTSVNDLPAANADSASTSEDTDVLIDVLANDFDIEDGISISSVSAPSHGAAVVESGKIRYTPSANYYGTDSFTYLLIDNEAATSTATVTITVTSVNDAPPVATADSAVTNEDTSVLVDVLANDNDVDGALTISSVSSASHGTALIESGKIRYTPSANYYGADSFTYTISDSDGATSTATVSVTVTSVNDLPTANADTASTPEDTSVLIDVLANDNDVEDGISISSVSVPSHGAAVVESGKIRYTPSANYNGYDSFTYVLVDSEAATSTAAVTVAVGSVNDAPTLSSGVTPSTGNRNTDFTYDVTYTDVDNDAPVFVRVYIDGVQHAMSPANPADTDYTNGALFIYTTKVAEGSSHVFYFEASDDTITVQSITYSGPTVGNNNPVLASIGSKTVSENSQLQFSVSGSDPDGDSVTFSASNLPSGASFAGQTFTWTPSYAQSGSYDVTFTVSDGSLTDSEIVTISVSNVNRAPVLASIGNKQVNEDAQLSFTITATDEDEDSLAYSASGLPSGATFNQGTRTFTWTPSYVQSGSYGVTFTVSDGTSTDSETITITVGNVDRAPVLAPIGNKQATENLELSFTVSATDDDGESLAYSASGLPSGATFNQGTKTFTWTPGYTQSGSYQVTFSVSDGSLTDSETITITVSNKDRNPVITTTPVTKMTVESPTQPTLYQYDVDATDEDADALEFSLLQKPKDMTINPTTGLITWQMDKEDKGRHNVRVAVYDGKGGYAIQSFTIDIGLGRDVEGLSGRVKISKIILNEGENYRAGDYIKVGVTFYNADDKNIRELKGTVSIPELGISRRVGPVYLESDKEATSYTYLEIPEDAQPGEYLLRVSTSASSGARHRYITID